MTENACLSTNKPLVCIIRPPKQPNICNVMIEKRDGMTSATNRIRILGATEFQRTSVVYVAST